LVALDLIISTLASLAIMSFSPMRKSSQYERALLLFLAVVIFPTVKIATATNARSQPASAVTVANDPNAGEEIPTGFKLERYARVWEHNPFSLVAPTAPQAQRSRFDKLFLTSWLKDGRTDVIFIQNLETNKVEKITAGPNQDNLRLIALHLNPNPQLVEAVISDGKEQGVVKFRFDAQSPAGQTASPVAQAVSATLPRPQVNPPNAQTPALQANTPVDQPLSRRVGSGTPSAQMHGGPGRAPRGQQSEGVRLPPPQTFGQTMPGKS
jgi:hypothetical protein